MKLQPAIAGIKILLFTIFTIHKEEMFESAMNEINVGARKTKLNE